MVYVTSFFIYLCVDICHRLYDTPYNCSINSGNTRGNTNLFNTYPQICIDCISIWDSTFLGNASRYTRFFFFSRKTWPSYTEINFQNSSSLAQSGFDTNKKTKLLIHGWRDGGYKHFPPRVTDGYFAAHDVNVISVDWSSAAGLSYPLARVAVQPVGIYVARFLVWLLAQTQAPLNSVHVVGHSLGAHIAGVVGKNMINRQLSRITGLDPAGPGFSWDQESRLSSTDAAFVDVIHTSGWWAGYYDPLGDADFYPNGGFPDQPGCPTDWGTCSHTRSYRLFIESITNDGFVAKACTSWFDYTSRKCDQQVTAVMGEQVDLRAKGKFYLYTSGAPPYAIGNNTTQGLLNKLKHNRLT